MSNLFIDSFKSHIVQHLLTKYSQTHFTTHLSLFPPLSCSLRPNPLQCDLIHMSACDCQAPKGNRVGSRACQSWIQYLNSFVVSVTTSACATVQRSRKAPEPVLLTTESVKKHSLLFQRHTNIHIHMHAEGNFYIQNYFYASQTLSPKPKTQRSQHTCTCS